MFVRIVRHALLTSLGLLIIGCGATDLNYINRNQILPISFLNAGTLKQCEKAINDSNQQLWIAKERARNIYFIDWGDANEMFAEAIEAQQNGYYALCVVKANELKAFLKHEENYEVWQKTVHL